MKESPAGRRLRAGIVGGGKGSFIGAVHRIAAELDAEALIVAGALSSDPATARTSAEAWRLARSYDSWEAMAQAEAARADGIDFVIVATPNHLHLPVARAFLKAGIHVICDKPLSLSVADATEFAPLVEGGRPLFALTHTYAGYPMVLQARAMVAAGELGTLRRVMVEYLQDWLLEPLEQQGNKQAGWRADPAKSGIGGAMADIGTHAGHLVEFVSGMEISELCADLSRFGAGRKLDDDANLLLRLAGGARGTLCCSQIACGEENEIRIRLYGTKAALDWRQLDANTLVLKQAGKPWQLLRTAGPGSVAESRAATRVPPGHPEGYLEAFGNLYRAFMADVRRVAAGEPAQRNYPGVQAGLRGMKLIAAAVDSSARGGVWVKM